MLLDTIYVLAVATLIPGAGLFSARLFSDWLFCVSVKPLATAAVFLCCIDFHCTLLVSLCCYSGVWCVALAIVLTAPVTAAALLLSRPPVGNSVFDVKHLDGSHSASGLSFTTSHWPGQQPCQRNTAEGMIAYLFGGQRIHCSIRTCITTLQLLLILPLPLLLNAISMSFTVITRFILCLC